jgi:hypothetical protein
MNLIDLFDFSTYFKKYDDRNNAKIGHVNEVIENLTILEDTVANIPTGGPVYKSYKALLSQSGTGAPTVVTVMENTLNITPVFTRVLQGIYLITSAGSFPEGNTRFFGLDKVVTFSVVEGIGTVSTNQGLHYGQGDVNELYINTYNAKSEVAIDGVLNGWTTWIEIQVKNI